MFKMGNVKCTDIISIQEWFIVKSLEEGIRFGFGLSIDQLLQ